MRVHRLHRVAFAALVLTLTAAGCSTSETTESTTDTASKCPDKSQGAPGGGNEKDPIVQIAGALPDDAAGKVDAGLFTKPGPWKIGMSHFGANANTWAQQVVHETKAAAAANPNIEEFILLDADLKQDKQVADIEDLIAQKVDAIIVMPLTPTSADPGIEAAKKAGIPVVLHTGRVETDAWTTQLQGGAENFGRVMGQYLVDCTGGKGNIWVLRGLSGHPEDTNRYNGLVEALEGTDLKISSEEYADWQYDTTKPICEQLMIDDPDPAGIWSSGADSTRACVDVFEEMGKPIPPITGEGNNGYMVQAVEKKLNTISAVYSPAQGAAGVRLAAALLEGKEIARSYKYEPPGDLLDNITAQYDAELSDNVWWPSELKPDELTKLYGK